MSESKLSRIEDKLDKVLDRVGAIDVTLAEQHMSLKEHMKRSDMLEKKMEPLEKHVVATHGALKLIGLIATIAAIAEGVSSVIEVITKK